MQRWRRILGASAVLLAAAALAPALAAAAPAPAEARPSGASKSWSLRRGDANAGVANVQRRLSELGYDPGPVDGRFGAATEMAVWAYEKAHGRAATGIVRPELWKLMETAPEPGPLLADGPPTRLEIDLARQLVAYWQDGRRVVLSHASSGTGLPFCENGVCDVAVTPAGRFLVQRRTQGWRESPLGKLYNPIYFFRGWAVHGSYEVPPYPASHGCVRLPMHVADRLFTLVPDQTPVYVVGVPPLRPAAAPTPAAAAV
ncbi:MAG: peptidoglycan-binding protein [Acidimicrobiales bacterium]